MSWKKHETHSDLKIFCCKNANEQGLILYLIYSVHEQDEMRTYKLAPDNGQNMPRIFLSVKLCIYIKSWHFSIFVSMFMLYSIQKLHSTTQTFKRVSWHITVIEQKAWKQWNWKSYLNCEELPTIPQMTIYHSNDKVFHLSERFKGKNKGCIYAKFLCQHWYLITLNDIHWKW